MGKLNYAARKTEGVKAGQTVSKDLRKKIPPGIGSKAAARDPYLEIDLTGKELTDAGFAEFIDDLIACLEFRGEDHPGGAVRLTELSLKGNKLTVASLEKLGKVIACSHGDLRDLDISENEITIDQPQHADIWKGFLDSFQGCYTLKRIDFSGNEIGARGFELLCRAYMQSDLDFVEPSDGEATVNGDGEQVESEHALHEAMNTMNIGGNKENVKAGADHTKGGKSKAARAVRTGSVAASAALSPAEISRFACTRGLRSVPYLILTNMGLTNACAFHLSVILLSHRLPEALLNFLPSGKSVDVTEYDEQCKGVIYLPNGTLQRAAIRLIELAEINRQEVLETESAESDSDASASPGNHSPYANGGRERGTKRRETRKQHQTILERAKKILLLDVLKSDGLHSNELWSVAFRMVVVSRAILLDDKSRSSTQASEEGKSLKENSATETPKKAIASKSLTSACFEENDAPHLFAPGAEDFDINFPSIQKSIQMPTTTAKRSIAPNTPEGNSRQGKKKPHGNIHGRSGTTGASNALKEEEVGRFGWPLELWRVIIAKGVGADGILSREQQLTIIRYASNWSSLEQELSIQGAAENQQIWKILDTVGCLAYSPMQ